MTTAASGRKGAGRTRILRAQPARKRTPAAARPKTGKTKDSRNAFSDQEWHDMVATAAYYRAEARGFDDVSAEDNWYQAEAELRDRISPGDASVEADSDRGGVAVDIETTGE